MLCSIQYGSMGLVLKRTVYQVLTFIMIRVKQDSNVTGNCSVSKGLRLSAKSEKIRRAPAACAGNQSKGGHDAFLVKTTSPK